MRNVNGNFLCESCCPGGKRTKMKNRCSSAECKCSPPIVNVHHYQCPLMKTPCPLHGYPFNYNLKSKKTPPEQCLVISFHPSLKTDKLFEPVKTFLNQTCEPDTKINFQYYSPRLSEAYGEDMKHCQVQTNLEDFKKLNSCFVKKTKSFFSDKTNRMKKLKQCFNSPCNSVVHKSRSCTAIREKIDRVSQEGTGDGYPDKWKTEKRIKDACCMKSEEGSHFLYKRDFDLSDGEKSSQEKIDSDFITKINNNVLDHNAFEIRSRKGFNERVGRVSKNMRPHFTYTSFVSPNTVRGKAQKDAHTEEISDLEKTDEGSHNPNDHSDELTEDKVKQGKAEPDGNVSSESSDSVYFTPFIFVPGRNDMTVEHREIQTVNFASMRDQWVQTIEYFPETLGSKNQTEKSEFAKREFMKTAETQTSLKFMSDEEGEGKPVKTNYPVQTLQPKRSARLFSDYKFFGNIGTSTNIVGVKEKSDKASMGTQTQDKFHTSTVIYYEPEMKFLRRDERPKDEKKSEAVAPVSVEKQKQEAPIKSTVVYYEPEMKFLRRDKRPEDEKRREAVAPVSMEKQTKETPISSTVIYYEPEMKFLRKDEKPKDEKKSEAVAPVSMEKQKQEAPIKSTVVYYEPEMKFLKREESSENKKKGVETEGFRSVGVQTEEESEEEDDEKEEESRREEMEIQETRSLSSLNIPKTGTTSKSEDKDAVEKLKNMGVQTQEIPMVVYYEPEMKFLSRVKGSEGVTEGQEVNNKGVQVQPIPKPVTVIFFEPETKPLKRKGENGKRGVLFSEQTQVKEIETGTKEKSVGTEPETLEESEREKYDSDSLIASQNKEIQTNSDSDTSQSYFDGSDASNATYVVKSYVSEESEQVVVKNWNKSRSDGDMLEKKKCYCLVKADQDSPPSCQCEGTNPNGLAFVGVYRSKKETYASSNPQDWTKAQASKPERTTKKNEDNNSSFADLSDLIRIIDENFKKMFDRRIGNCECQQMREAKPTADKEVMTVISGAHDIDVILQMAARSMANAQIQTSLPAMEIVPLAQPSYSRQEQPTLICKRCAKVINTKTLSVGTNTPTGSYIDTKIQEVDLGTYRADFTIENNQKASSSKPQSTEKPSTSKGKSGRINSVRTSTKTFVTKFEKLPEPIQNRPPASTRPKNITYPEPFSDSNASLQKDLRRAQKECGVKPKSSRPTPSPRPKPTPKPRQAQLPQSRPQVVTRVIPDAQCGNIVATTTTRQIPSRQVQETCPFKPPSINCENFSIVCPPPPRSNTETRDPSAQPKKEPDCKRNYMTYHVTLSPLWSKDIRKIFERKLRKISKSEFSFRLSDSSGKQKRNHEDGNDGGPNVKKIKSSECEKTNLSDTNQLEHSFFELGEDQTDILFKFLTKGENEVVLEEESPRLTKDSGFVWIPSFSTPQFFTIRKVTSSEETTKPKDTLKEVSRTRSQVLSKVPEEDINNKDTCQQSLEYTDEKNLLRKLFRCSSCKSLTYLQLKNSEIMEKPKNNSTNYKSSLEECFKNLVYTPRSHSLVETDEQINSEQILFETVPSTETNIPLSDSEQDHKFFHEINSKLLSEQSDSYFGVDLNQVKTCSNLEPASSNSDKGFSLLSSNMSSLFYCSPDVSNSKMAIGSENFTSFPFCAKSNSAVPDSKKTILKNFPSKIFLSSRKKSK